MPMKIAKDDIRWLKEILLTRDEDAVPAFNLSRLKALEFIKENREGLVITARGQDAIAEHHRTHL